MNFKILTYLLIGGFILSGCVQDPEPPEDLIPKREMVELLIQIHLLEAKMNKVPKRPKDSTQLVFDHYQAMIFEDFGIDSARYRRSMSFYLEYPKEFTSVYQAVVDSLALRAKNKNID